MIYTAVRRRDNRAVYTRMSDLLAYYLPLNDGGGEAEKWNKNRSISRVGIYKMHLCIGTYVNKKNRYSFVHFFPP